MAYKGKLIYQNGDEQSLEADTFYDLAQELFGSTITCADAHGGEIFFDSFATVENRKATALVIQDDGEQETVYGIALLIPDDQ